MKGLDQDKLSAMLDRVNRMTNRLDRIQERDAKRRADSALAYEKEKRRRLRIEADKAQQRTANVQRAFDEAFAKWGQSAPQCRADEV
jgi:hypothetical protein